MVGDGNLHVGAVGRTRIPTHWHWQARMQWLCTNSPVFIFFVSFGSLLQVASST